MIENQQRYEITKLQAEKFLNAIQQFETLNKPENISEVLWKAEEVH